MRSKEEKNHYRILSKIRRVIETRFFQLQDLGLKFIRAVSRKGLAVKMI